MRFGQCPGSAKHPFGMKHCWTFFDRINRSDRINFGIFSRKDAEDVGATLAVAPVHLVHKVAHGIPAVHLLAWRDAMRYLLGSVHLVHFVHPVHVALLSFHRRFLLL